MTKMNTAQLTAAVTTLTAELALAMTRIDALEAAMAAKPTRKATTGKRGKGDQRLCIVKGAEQPKMGATSIDGYLTNCVAANPGITRDELAGKLSAAIDGKKVKTTREPKDLVSAYSAWGLRLGFVAEAPAVEVADSAADSVPMEVVLADAPEGDSGNDSTDDAPATAQA